jgi:hypothetical protein
MMINMAARTVLSQDICDEYIADGLSIGKSSLI